MGRDSVVSVFGGMLSFRWPAKADSSGSCMAGCSDCDLSSGEWNYGGEGCDCGTALAHTGDGFFSAQFFNERKGRLWRWLGAFDDRIVFRIFTVFYDFADRAFVGVYGRHHFACVQENTTR